MDNRHSNHVVGSSGQFGIFCWVTWIVFMILYYGTDTIAHWPVFWVWFPFWLPFATSGVAILIFLIIVLITRRLE